MFCLQAGGPNWATQVRGYDVLSRLLGEEQGQTWIHLKGKGWTVDGHVPIIVTERWMALLSRGNLDYTGIILVNMERLRGYRLLFHPHPYGPYHPGLLYPLDPEQSLVVLTNPYGNTHRIALLHHPLSSRPKPSIEILSPEAPGTPLAFLPDHPRPALVLWHEEQQRLIWHQGGRLSPLASLRDMVRRGTGGAEPLRLWSIPLVRLQHHIPPIGLVDAVGPHGLGLLLFRWHPSPRVGWIRIWGKPIQDSRVVYGVHGTNLTPWRIAWCRGLHEDEKALLVLSEEARQVLWIAPPTLEEHSRVLLWTWMAVRPHRVDVYWVARPAKGVTSPNALVHDRIWYTEGRFRTSRTFYVQLQEDGNPLADLPYRPPEMGAAFAPDDRNAVWVTTVNAETRHLILTSEAVFREAMQSARRVFAVEEGFREVEVEWKPL